MLTREEADAQMLKIFPKHILETIRAAQYESRELFAQQESTDDIIEAILKFEQRGAHSYAYACAAIMFTALHLQFEKHCAEELSQFNLNEIFAQINLRDAVERAKKEKRN